MNKNWKTGVMALAIFPVYILISDSIFRLFMGYRLISPRAAVYDLAIGLILGSFLFAFKSKKGRIVYVAITGFAVALLFLSQLIYYKYYTDLYSFVRLTNFKEFLSVKGETAKGFDIRFLSVFIPYLVLVALTWIGGDYARSFKKLSICFVVGLIIFNAVRLTFIDKMEDKTQVYLTDSYLYDTAFNKEKTAERFGLMVYSYRDLYNFAKNSMPANNGAEVAAINDYLSENHREKKINAMTGQFAGKNLVFVVCESLDDWAINETFSPTLYRLASEGIYSENYYSPVFTNSTVDSEFILNTGMVPSLDYGNTSYVFNNNSYPFSLGNLFKDKGYRTAAFHSNSGDFYNRYQYYDILGYEEFNDSKVLDIKVPEHFGYDWPTDSELFEKTSEKIVADYDGYPFYSYVLTVVTHTPYDDNRIELKDNLKFVQENLDCNSEVQYYFAAVMDLDKGVEMMLKRFEEAGILEDTVFVFTGDHYSYGMYHDLIWEYDIEDIYSFYKIHKVPFIIWTPGIESYKPEEIISSFEMYPTLANLFDLDYDPDYCLGNDIFNKDGNTVIFGERHFWQDDKALYEKGNVVSREDENYTDDMISDKNNEIVEKIDIFQRLLKCDYFKNYRKGDE